MSWPMPWTSRSRDRTLRLRHFTGIACETDCCAHVVGEADLSKPLSRTANVHSAELAGAKSGLLFRILNSIPVTW